MTNWHTLYNILGNFKENKAFKNLAQELLKYLSELQFKKLQKAISSQINNNSNIK